MRKEFKHSTSINQLNTKEESNTGNKRQKILSGSQKTDSKMTKEF